MTRGRIEQEELPQSLPGQFYEGPSSIPRRVPVGRECDPHQAFSKVQIPLIAPPHYVILIKRGNNMVEEEGRLVS